MHNNGKEDIIIIGCGLCGGAIARVLAEYGCSVRIIERRNHIAGNMYDYVDGHGILVHKYGPHTFHANDKRLVDFICRFSEWNEYHLTCGAEINGICTPTPFNFKTIDTFFTEQQAKEIKRHLLDAYPNQDVVTVLELLQGKDEIIRNYAQFLFDNDYKLYTAKQWGIPATEIDPSVLKRVPIRLNYKEGYFNDKYQLMPASSYTEFFEELLNHANISIGLNQNALDFLSVDEEGILYNKRPFGGKVVYTGAIDELFDFCYGKLPYRSLLFKWRHENIESKQKYPVVAYPQQEGYTRIVEYKKLPVQDVTGTSYEMEYSIPHEIEKQTEPYYPVLTKDSQKLYQQYLAKACRISNLFLCGRLADFQYYNMDQALNKALSIADEIKQSLV